MKIFFYLLLALGFQQTVIAGEFPDCTTQDGRHVTLYRTQSTEGGPAFATIMKGEPVIVFNEELMSHYAHSKQTRLFIYLHECGHQALGHTVEESKSHRHTNEEELAADCYASEQMAAMGATEQDLETVTQDLKLLRKDPDHPGHIKRISNVHACFGN